MHPYVGSRLDVFLAARLHRYSRARVQRLISEGSVFLGGKTAKASHRVLAGEKVVIRYPARQDAPALHDVLPVLYEDDVLLAVNKPGDILSHPTDKTLNNSATAILARQFPGVKLYLAHRLDRETSGVLLLGKSVPAARSLSGQFADRLTKKEYWAVVAGRVGFKRKTVDRPIGYDSHGIRVRQRVFEPGEGAAAKTRFECLEAGDDLSLVRALPLTGRLHQIRVHLAWLGHPVLGDKLYTGDGEFYLKAWKKEISPEDLKALGAPRQMLHARRLELTHPVSGKRIRLEAPLPPDFVLSRPRLSCVRR